MKALILKDLLCLRQQAKSVGLVLLVWLVLSVAMGNGMFFCALGVIYVIMLPMMTLSYDERSKWDSRALTMPVTRAQLVLSRYATALLAGLALCALGGYPIGRMGATVAMFPIFMASWVPLQVMALFVPVRRWSAIEHSGQPDAEKDDSDHEGGQLSRQNAV